MAGSRRRKVCRSLEGIVIFPDHLHSGILVPGGFGNRGTEGMVLAIKYAREQKIPFFGICLGFQMAVIEWARNVLEIQGKIIFSINWMAYHSLYPSQDATSAEFVPDAKHPIVIFMPEISRTHMGGTMRLGLRPTVFEPGTETWSQARQLYGGVGKIWERHRHRYEVNPKYVSQLNDSGLVFSGKDEKGERMQILELRGASLFSVLDKFSYLPSAFLMLSPLLLLRFGFFCCYQIILFSWVSKHIPSSAPAHSIPRHPSSVSSQRLRE